MSAQARIRRATAADARWVVARHADLYARDDGFDASFGDLVSRIVADFFDAHNPARESAWIAEGGERLGSIFCARIDDETARLRLFLVEPEARGTGLGRRLLARCTSFAREAGYRRMALDTHKSHRAAIRLYTADGFSCTFARPVISFGQRLVEQTWTRDL